MDDFDYNNIEFIEYINSNNVFVFGWIVMVDNTCFEDIIIVTTLDNREYAFNNDHMYDIRRRFLATKRDNVINTVLDDRV